MNQYTRNPRTLAERLWSNVDIGADDECWNWLGYKTPFGSGRIGIGQTTAVTSRVAWEVTHGKVKSGLKVLHKCDNPACCNPNHLFVGTQHENILDMNRKGRAVFHILPSGEQHPNAKLTDGDVRLIRKLARDGVPRKELCARFKMSDANMSRIINLKAWTHIKD